MPPMKPSPRLHGPLAAALLLLPALPSPAAETKLNGHSFTLPDGFTIEPLRSEIQKLPCLVLQMDVAKASLVGREVAVDECRWETQFVESPDLILHQGLQWLDDESGTRAEKGWNLEAD